ncbi:MAG TPA: sodium:glutamate symporter, partial [Phycisphaerae bacterium]|nr:sodium:glutamate symporter [Phycisphaerae bacterium]
QWLYLPSCVIAGLLGLAVLQLTHYFGPHIGWSIPPSWTAGWNKLPGLLINVVFACLFLGVKIPGFRKIWDQAAPQLAYGQVVAWGQYVVGIGLTLLILTPVFGVPEMFGAIIPVGFEGGHGTAGGMKEVFESYGFAGGGHLGMASATMGMISAIVVGMILVNWAVRRGHAVRKQKMVDRSEDDSIGVIPVGQRPPAGRLTVKADVIESFTLHLVFVGLAVGFGYLVKFGMNATEEWLNADLIFRIQQGLAPANDRVRTSAFILNSFPTFPLCMIGGILVQIWEQKFDKRKLMDHGLTRRIQNASLDFLVVPAIAMISIVTIQSFLWPFLIVIGAAILWNVFCLMVLARRMLPNVWFERSIAEMGQSMGVTSTGLLLLRVVDPDYETPAAGAFAYKQIMHEPFMGGGLWTSAAVPLIFIWGGLPVLGIACGAVAFWLILTFLTPIIRNKETSV